MINLYTPHLFLFFMIRLHNHSTILRRLPLRRTEEVKTLKTGVQNLTYLCQPNHTNLRMSETGSWDA
jgi:hypothetical protein